VTPHRYAYLDAPLPLAFAHRGGAAAGDENTVDAFVRAIDLGYRYIETDTHATADGVAVVFHDPTLERVLGRPGLVRDLRWADLATERVNGAAAVPRLADVLGDWAQIRFNIDVKADDAVEPTIEAVRRTGAQDRVLLASFSDARLLRMRRALGPSVATSMGTREVVRLWVASRYGRRRRQEPQPHPDQPHHGHHGHRGPRPHRVPAAQVPVRRGRIRVVDGRFVRHAHRRGVQVHVWTIDDAAEMNELLDLGVDGIMTDRIEVLREVYQARGHWS
jgi:glycerophosphoryl diester phosphodiesterase